MIPQYAQHLTRIFATATAVAYPFLLPRAHITTTTGCGTSFEATAHTPEETAEILKLFSSNTGLFQRHAQHHFTAPLQLSMDHVPRAPQDGKRTETRALHMLFRDSDPHSFVWLHNHPTTSHGPTLDTTIATLQRAGRNWEKVNFTFPPDSKGGHLRVVR